jgi:UTP--glucose-1-phosphate uridylyltransferase
LTRAESSLLARELASLPQDIHALLARHRFDTDRFLSLAWGLQDGRGFDNRVKEGVLPPERGDIDRLPEDSEARARLESLGRDALRSGQVALLVLAGGMATRMGGMVKALVEVLPGRTFLDLRLAEQDAIARSVGRRPPLWIMTSHGTDSPIREALLRDSRGEAYPFPQRLSVRLTPDGHVFLDADGMPSLYSPGHGDAVDALQDSGLLEAFVSSGGRTVMVTNLDNLGATLDATNLGFHLASGAKVTSEVVDRRDADCGALLVRWRRGAGASQSRETSRLTVLEDFRLPIGFDVSSAPVFNVNTFYFDATALFEMQPAWTYFAVRKKVEGAEVIQFERLINEVVDWLPTRFLHVARSGKDSRFLPVKDGADLVARRRDIEAVATARGILYSLGR